MTSNSDSRSLYFVWFGGSAESDGDVGIIIPESDYYYCHPLQTAIESARTWGGFENMLPDGVFESLSIWMCNDGEYVYATQGRVLFTPVPGEPLEAMQYGDMIEEGFVLSPSDSFDCSLIPGVEDGDVPPWIQCAERNPLPDEIIEVFGVPYNNPNGFCWVYPEERYCEIKKALQDFGYELHRPS